MLLHDFHQVLVGKVAAMRFGGHKGIANLGSEKILVKAVARALETLKKCFDSVTDLIHRDHYLYLSEDQGIKCVARWGAYAPPRDTFNALINFSGSLRKRAQRLKEIDIIGHLGWSVRNLDIADNAFLVDDKEGALGHTGGVPHTVEINDVALRIEIGEQRERDIHRSGPGIQRIRAIHADAHDLGVRIPEALQVRFV